MSLYAESSAILAWLLGEERGAFVREELARADVVCASELTLVECDRALHRAAHEKRISEAAASARRAVLARSGTRWILLGVSPDVLERARRPFPAEPAAHSTRCISRRPWLHVQHSRASMS